MRLKAAVIGILPKGVAVRDLEDLTGMDFGRVCFSQDFSAMEDALPAYDYVLITEQEAKRLPQHRLRDLRRQSNARWVLLTEEQESDPPEWARGLEFQHYLTWRESPEGERGVPAPPLPTNGHSRFVLNMRSGELHANELTIKLTPRECRMMAAFLKRPNQVIRKEELLAEVWGRDDHQVNLVQVTIRRLRRKLADQGVSGEVIENFRGFGYRLHAAKAAVA